MTSAGGIRKATFGAGGHVVWLVERRLRTEAPRDVLVALDRSDSCGGDRDATRRLLQLLVHALNPGDRCVAWALGAVSPAWSVEIAPGAPSPARLFDDAMPTETRGGTWLELTWRAMANWPQPPGVRIVRLIASDGEVFDAGALEADPALSALLPGAGFFRIKGKNPVTPVPQLQKCQPIELNESCLRAFLAGPSPRIDLCCRSAAPARRYSANGELPAGDPFVVDASEGWLRIAFEGGPPPDIELRYNWGGIEWTDRDFGIEDLQAGSSLWSVVRQIHDEPVQWIPERLAALASGSPEFFTCLHHGCRGGADPTDTLFCAACSCFLLTSSRLQRLDIPPQWRPVARVAVDNLGGHPERASGMPRLPGTTESRPFVVADGWLYLDMVCA